MDSDSLERLEGNLRLFRQPRVRKIASSPWKFIHAGVLQAIATRRPNGLAAKAMLFSGEDMTVVFPEYVSVALWQYGFYEEGLTRMLLEHLKPGMIFFDIGAHFGYYTLLGSGIVGDQGQVHSFEPTPRTFEVLQSNVKDKPNVHLNRIAVSSKPGTVTLNDYGVRFAGHNSLHRGRFDGDELERIEVTKHEVQTTTLDDYVNSEGVRPHFVKIDAESAEYEILEGMTRTMEEMRPIISIEVGDKDIEGVLSSKDLISYLSGKRYQSYEFKEGRISIHEPKDRYEWDNLLFVPVETVN